MGYFIKDRDKIVKITEPSKFSLSANPNFVQFEAASTEPEKIVFTLEVIGQGSPRGCYFVMTETKTKKEHLFQQIQQGDTPSDDWYYFTFSENKEIRAQNIAFAFKRNNYFATNFDISTEGNIVILTSKTADRNENYLFTYSNRGEPNILKSSDQPFYPDADTRVDITFKVTDNLENVRDCTLKFTETVSKASHEFKGTRNQNEASDNTFFISDDPGVTANNIRRCLMLNPFFRDMFDCGLPIILNENGQLINNPTIRIVSKGISSLYSFTYEIESPLVYVEGTSRGYNSEQLSFGMESEIHLDMYKNNNVFPGKENTPNPEYFGEYTTTLTKTYQNAPLWFNINSLAQPTFTPLAFSEDGWQNTQTVSDIRFIAHRLFHGTRQVLYASDVFYAVNGYQRTLETNDLSAHVYDTSKETKAKPLTTQPQLFHIEGQTQYFNFLLSDADHDNEAGGNLAITYRILSQSGRFLTEKVMHAKPKHLFHAVNTIRLDIDGAISGYPNAGRVEVFLSRSLPDEDKYTTVSEPLRFRILPSCLHKVNDFAFLNSLGGWSSFNFGGTDQSEFKTTTNTIFKTHTPDKTVSSQLEAVFSKDVEEQFSVQTMPITRDVAEWLRELSTSKAVYELSTKRYIIVDELVIKPNSKDDLFRLDMKYRYSDTYNAK